ncbi:hypothetical protein AB4Z19_07215 [Pseudoduganella sp. RAF19]|uniref:hypothetical protein n=2 Tax=unclassified Pseudoduganella TaxID=2637179 RepID=UPI003F9BE3C1
MAVAQSEERQIQRNMEQLSAALSSVIADFHRQFDTQLRMLAGLAESSQDLYRKQRNEQMEAMHHARRIASQVDETTGEFARLLADASALTGLAADIRQSLDLLGPRQQAIDSGMAQQALSMQSMADAISDLRAGFDEASEQLIAQSRRAFDTMGQRVAQNGSALNKELNETLIKAMANLQKQLNSITSRMSTDIAPMAQQLKRVSEQSRNLR